jgi:hypothetical protein
VATLWQERRDANRERTGFTVTVSAPTNAEAHDISMAIRAQRRATGEIGHDKVALAATDGQAERSYSLALAKGDRVRLFKRVNATFAATGRSSNIGRNGTVLEVAGIRNDGLMLRSVSGKVGFVPWDRLHDDKGRVQLAYGDALTTYTGQGSTVTEHIHAMPSGSRLVTALGAYTSGSRHREQSFIVTSDGAERAEIAGRRPLGDRREINPSDVLANVIRNLSRQDEKESAVSMLERAANVRRGTIRSVQASLQRMEASTAARGHATSMQERLQLRRINRALENRMPGLAERLRQQSERFVLLARAGSVFAERLAALARAKRAVRQNEREYWHDVAARASPTSDQAQGKARRHGHSR